MIDAKNLELRGIVYREMGQWFAHCLELDIVAEGESPDSALGDLIDLCVFQIETAMKNDDLESIFRPAPARFWNLYFSPTRKSRLPKSPPSTMLKRFDARELVLA